MQKIFKRLELIKAAIVLEDTEIIIQQVEKLSAMQIDESVEEILESVSRYDYTSVITDIEKYIARYSGMIVYEDRELQGLRLELKMLENKLQGFSEQKSEYLGMIDDFNTQYHLRTGAIIQKILTLKEELLLAAVKKKEEAFETLKKTYEQVKEKTAELKEQANYLEKELEETDVFDDRYDELYEELQSIKEEIEEKEEDLEHKRQEAKNAKKKLDEDDTTQEYKESRQDREAFEKEYKEKLNEEHYDLSVEEELELKKLFRKAARLCHPDIVSNELKGQAQIMMQDLNDAYAKKDLAQVREILISLESEKGFVLASDSITDIQILRAKIISIRKEIDGVSKETETIEQDETYLKIQKIGDWDTYFDELSKQLETEYEVLLEHYRTSTSEDHKEHQMTQDKQEDKEGDLEYFDVDWD